MEHINMCQILAELNPRGPESLVALDSAQITRAIILRILDTPDDLAAITLYPLDLAVAYSRGYMSIRGGAGGRENTARFVRWLRRNGVAGIECGTVTREVYDGMIASRVFKTSAVGLCAADEDAILTEMIRREGPVMPTIRFAWGPTDTGRRCEAAAVSPITGQEISVSGTVGWGTSSDFDQFAGAVTGRSAEEEMESCLRAFIWDAIQSQHDQAANRGRT